MYIALYMDCGMHIQNVITLSHMPGAYESPKEHVIPVYAWVPSK